MVYTVQHGIGVIVVFHVLALPKSSFTALGERERVLYLLITRHVSILQSAPCVRAPASVQSWYSDGHRASVLICCVLTRHNRPLPGRMTANRPLASAR